VELDRAADPIRITGFARSLDGSCICLTFKPNIRVTRPSKVASATALVQFDLKTNWEKGR
jgi:hypothetical protein